jgi:hypothetical protein
MARDDSKFPPASNTEGRIGRRDVGLYLPRRPSVMRALDLAWPQTLVQKTMLGIAHYTIACCNQATEAGSWATKRRF